MQLARVAVLVMFACSEKSSPAPQPPPKPARTPLACGDGTAEKLEPWRQQISPGAVFTEGEQAWCEKPDGTRHGPLRITYLSGKRAAEGAYADGLRDGPWTVWYGERDRGKAIEEVWRKGKREGTWRSFRTDGKPAGEGQFEDGKLVAWFEYDEQGTKKPVDKRPEIPTIDE